MTDRPKHYRDPTPFAVARAWRLTDPAAFSVLKYLARYQYKGQAIEDVEKLVTSAKDLLRVVAGMDAEPPQNALKAAGHEFDNEPWVSIPEPPAKPASWVDSLKAGDVLIRKDDGEGMRITSIGETTVRLSCSSGYKWECDRDLIGRHYDPLVIVKPAPIREGDVVTPKAVRLPVAHFEYGPKPKGGE